MVQGTLVAAVTAADPTWASCLPQACNVHPAKEPACLLESPPYAGRSAVFVRPKFLASGLQGRLEIAFPDEDGVLYPALTVSGRVGIATRPQEVNHGQVSECRHPSTPAAVGSGSITTGYMCRAVKQSCMCVADPYVFGSCSLVRSLTLE